jgi:HPt (histidine-containing phosphotransfer) domain-containing protein
MTAIPLNLQRLREICADDTEALADLVREGVVTLAELIRELRSSVDSGIESARVAHEIKGVSLMVGAEEVAELSAAIEQLAKNGEGDEVKARLLGLEDAQRRLMQVAATCL